MQFTAYLKICSRIYVIVLAFLAPGSLNIVFAKPVNASGSGHFVVLKYHRFGQTSSPASNISIEQFRSQLDFLEAGGFQVWPLSKAISYLRAGREIPDKVVVITIDEAHISVFNHAWPELTRRGMPFAVFVSGKAIDEAAVNMMSWTQMQVLHKAGVEFANHGWSHAHLIRRKRESRRAWQKRVEREIDYNQRRLREELGEVQPAFAWPYGEYSRDLGALLKQKSYTGFSDFDGVVSAGANLQALPRFVINESRGAVHAFSARVYALPFLAETTSRHEPVLKPGQAIRMRLEARPGFSLRDVNCYASEFRRISLELPADNLLIARVERGFRQRRGTLNCTLYDDDRGRDYWLSQLWIQPWLSEEAGK